MEITGGKVYEEKNSTIVINRYVPESVDRMRRRLFRRKYRFSKQRKYNVNYDQRDRIRRIYPMY